jgi:uncharacterized protein
VIVDTSAIYGFLDRKDSHHLELAALFADGRHRLIVSPLVIAELDYLVLSRLGVAAELAMLQQLTGGGFEIAEVTADDLLEAHRLVSKYDDLKIGVTDAINVVLAEKFGIHKIATLDHRHYRVIRCRDGKVLELLP